MNEEMEQSVIFSQIFVFDFSSSSHPLKKMKTDEITGTEIKKRQNIIISFLNTISKYEIIIHFLSNTLTVFCMFFGSVTSLLSQNPKTPKPRLK